MIRVHPVLAGVIVVGFALFVLWRVRVDYATRGSLSLPSTVLQFLMFFVHGLASYSFLDSRCSRVATAGWTFRLAVLLMAVGLVAVVPGMVQLRWGDVVGRSVSGLRRTGVYRLTRNPQVMAYLLFLVGYALLWPAWLGLAWLGLYALVAHLMVLVEEAHLRRIFSRDFESYRRRTPRYFGLPKAE